MTKTGQGMYSDSVVLIGEIKSYHSNPREHRNWLRNLRDNKFKVVVQFTSRNPEMNEALEDLMDCATVSIAFPWSDIDVAEVTQ